MSPTFIFADLVGFTAYTERHGDDAAADLALAFCARVCDFNRDHGAEEIKLLGDGALVHVDDPAVGVDLALHLAERDGLPTGFPAVRVGIASGGAVLRGSDWFGRGVNLAARVVSEAPEGTALASASVLEQAGEVPGIKFESIGLRQLRGFRTPVELFAMTRTADPAVTHAALAAPERTRFVPRRPRF
jgi:class 3 adenylate cyclase